jgi:hypothetical protein
MAISSLTDFLPFEIFANSNGSHLRSKIISAEGSEQKILR